MGIRHLTDRQLLNRIMELEERGGFPQKLYGEEDRRGGVEALYARIERVDKLFRLRVPHDHKYAKRNHPD